MSDRGMTPEQEQQALEQALERLKEKGAPSNSAGLGVQGSQATGIEVGGFISKDLGKNNALEGQAGYSTRRGWGFTALWRKVWR